MESSPFLKQIARRSPSAATIVGDSVPRTQWRARDAKAAAGFTLVEMIVALAIIVIITAIVLTSQSAFDRGLTITDTAYSLALSIRQAQTYGLSSRVTAGGVTNAAYGVHFSGTNPSTYTFFADIYPVAPGAPSTWCPGHTSTVGPDQKPGNCTYDATHNELVQNYSFNRGFTISNVCGHDAGSPTTQRCTSGGYLTGLDIVYLRPNTDSIVTGITSTGFVSLLDAQITLSAPQGGTRLICVTSVGEVSVASSTCP